MTIITLCAYKKDLTFPKSFNHSPKEFHFHSNQNRLAMIHTSFHAAVLIDYLHHKYMNPSILRLHDV